MVITGRNEKELQNVVKECSLLGNDNVHYVTGEATVEEDCSKIVEFTMKKFGRIDIAVLSAGIGGHGIFNETIDVNMLKKMMDVNLYGSVNMTKYLVPHLRKAKGQLVVVSSLSGMIGIPYRTFYCSSKYAVNGFFNALHMEIGNDIIITQCNPTTISGTNFRANGLGGADNSKPSKDNVTAESCAQICVAAADRKIRNIVFPWKHYFLSIVDPLMPSLTQGLIQSKAKL